MNNADKHPIDSFFREHLHDSGEAAPPGSWERISGTLATRKKRKALLWWRMAAAVALLAMAFSAGYLLSGGDNRAPEMASGENVPVDTKTTSSEQDGISPVGINTGTTKPEEESLSSDGENEGLPPKEHRLLAAQEEIIPNTDIVNQKISTRPAIQEPVAQPMLKREAERITLAAIQSLPPSLLRNELLPERIDLRLEHLAFLTNPFWMEDEANDEASDLHWELGGSIAPLLAFRSVGANYDSEALDISTSAESAQLYGGTEIPLLAYSGGLGSSLEFADSWALGFGLRFTRLGQETENVQFPSANSTLGDGPEAYTAVTSAGKVDIQASYAEEMFGGNFTASNALASNRLVQQFEYLELPFTLRKQFLDGGLSLGVDAGISTSFLVGNRSYLQDAGTKQELDGTRGLREVLFNGTAGVNLGVPLSQNWGLAFRPGFRYALSSINENRSYSYRPWSLSFGTGVYYNLK